MTHPREPKISCDVFAPSPYTDAVMEDIIAATRLPIGERELHRLKDMVEWRAIQFRADWQVDQREATGQKSTEAWQDFIRRLASDYEKAFGRKATITRGGPFLRFTKAVLKPIELGHMTEESIRDTLGQIRAA